MRCLKIFYYIITVFSVILLHTSCDRKKESSLLQLTSETHFKAEFSELGYIFDLSKPIGVYIAYNGSSIFNSGLKGEYKEGLYSIDGSNKVSSSDFENKNINIYAYTPYQDASNLNFEKHPIKVETNQQSLVNYQASDFRYAVAQGTTLGDKIDLQFKEKLAEVIVNVKKKNFQQSDNDINVEIEDVATSANINLGTGVLSDPGDIGSIKLMRRDSPNSGFDYTMQAIFIPQEISAEKAILKIEIDGKVYTHQTKYDVIIEPAMQYIYNVVIDDLGVFVESGGVLHRTGEETPDNSSSMTTHYYQIGDYFPIADDKLSAIGVVFETYDKGLHGKIISLDEALDVDWGPITVTGAKSKSNGVNNKLIIERQNTSVSDYGALNWCIKKGKGWYLPAISELIVIHKQKDILNRSLSPLLRSNSLGDGVYLSSTENDEHNALVLYFGNGQYFQQEKSTKSRVRAVFDF